MLYLLTKMYTNNVKHSNYYNKHDNDNKQHTYALPLEQNVHQQ
jgi:hypothetical protein